MLSLATQVSAQDFVVDRAHAEASDLGPGSQQQPFVTIGAAIAKARAGDRILIKPGTYRETLRPAHSGQPEAPIQLIGDGPSGSVKISGREPWPAAWVANSGSLWVLPLPDGAVLTPRNPFRIAVATGPSVGLPPARPAGIAEPLPLTLGQVVIGGYAYHQRQRLAEVQAEPGTWLVDASGRGIVAHLRPGDRRKDLEIAVRDRCLAPARRHLSDIHLHNLEFVGAADQAPFPQRAMVGTGAGKRWRFTACIFREASSVGLDIGGETWKPEDLAADDAIIRGGFEHKVLGCQFLDNGLTGIAGWLARDVVIAGNLVRGNHRLRSVKGGAITWEEWGGIKLHGTNARVIANLVISNYGPGIWLDNGYDQAVVAGNLVLDNQLGGIFLELGAGSCRIENNIIAGVSAFSQFYPGDGIYCHDASGIEVVGNLITGANGAAIRMRTISERTFAGRPVETSSALIVGNQILGSGTIEMPDPGPRARDNVIGSNQRLPETTLRLRVNAERDEVRIQFRPAAVTVTRPESRSLLSPGGERHGARAWHLHGPWPTAGQNLTWGRFPLDPAVAESLANTP